MNQMFREKKIQLAIKNMKRYSTSFTITEIKIRIILIYHFPHSFVSDQKL